MTKGKCSRALKAGARLADFVVDTGVPKQVRDFLTASSTS
jgi:hypothetical protein